MSNILELVARDRSAFVPSNRDEVFALMLARKLNDVEGARSYVALVNRFGIPSLAASYHRALRDSTERGTPCLAMFRRLMDESRREAP